MTRKSKKSLQNRQFIQTLSALSPSELKTFKVFCHQSSSISNKTKSLFEYIYNAAPNFEKLTEEKILSRFFPNNPKAKIQLNYALHDLYALLRRWMIQKELETDEYLQNQLFMRACKNRFLHPQFFKKNRQLLDTLDDDYLEVPNTWHKRFETNFQLFYHVQTPKNQPEVKSFSDMENNLELFYFGSKLRLLCQNVIRTKTFKILPELDEDEMKTTLDFAQSHNHIPFFALYFQLIQYLQKPSIATLKEFIPNFKRDRTKLERLDQSILFYVAVNSLNNLTMQGDQTALNTQFELFKYAFEKDLVLFDNEMGTGPFNGFLLTACMLGKFKIARKMLKKYESYFKPDVREDFTNLMWSTLYFHEKKYDKVELSLNQFQFKNPSFRIRSRNLLLKSLYERYQKDKTLKDLILTELVKFRKYIHKQNSLPESRKKMYYTMISVIRKLTNASHRRPYYKTKIKEELIDFLSNESNKPLSSHWLLEKINSL